MKHSTSASNSISSSSDAAEMAARSTDHTFRLSHGRAHFRKDSTDKPPLYATSTNCILSSKYTVLTFLPLNLFEQFCNLANVYFLLVGILQVGRAIDHTWT